MWRDWRLFVPKTVTVLRQGYGLGDFRADLIAGLTVAIVALPLAMALAIASGTTPDVGLVTAVDSISAGALHSLAITVEGEVLAWGNDGNAQLGNGAGSADVTAPTAIDTQRTLIAVQSGPVGYFSAARDDNGDVWTWGSDAFAQLGNGAASAPVDAPVQVTEDSQWVDIAAGGLHTIAIDQDGVLWGWGANSEGSAGTGDGAIPVRYPTRITVPARFTDVAAAGLHSLALDDTGTIWGWGRNDDGQVGDGGAPFDVMTPRAISSGVVFTAISAGDFHSAALDSEGNIWTWGLDAYGELGNGPGGVGVVPVPQQITSGVTFTAVELGREVIWLHTYAERYVDPAAGREAGNVRSGWPMDAQPKSLEAVTTMPVKLEYDEARGQVVFTDDDGGRNGAWGPVPRAVFDYTVGGMNVIGSWFKYRKKNPGGKKTSPLDDIHVDEWPHEWTLEFTELLTVLTRLVSLEPMQAEVLEQILAGELITRDELVAAGVKWPETRDDRKPRRKVAADTLDIFGDEGS